MIESINPALYPAIINALSMIVAAIITTTGILFGASKIADRKKLQNDLIQAYRDIEGLYTIEQYHTQMNLTENGKDNKTHVRKLVQLNENLYLSGRNTISQVKRKIVKLEAIIT